MAVLMGTIALIVLIVGSAALSGHPLLFIAIAALLAAAMFMLTGRRRA